MTTITDFGIDFRRIAPWLGSTAAETAIRSGIAHLSLQ
jgi:hypothetical protein